MYFMDETYRPDLSRGVRWDDPVFGIDWPIEPEVISERDATYPDFRA
jgi:dTDP-4-dehydrorhamnose 3,5-epimerase